MRFENVAILSLAHVDAPLRVTSRELEASYADGLAKLGLSAGILEALTGINARRFYPPDVAPSAAATEAALLALKRADIPRSALGLLVNTSVCRDFVEPSCASLVHGNLGLSPTCLNFDLGNACLGFLNGMEMAALMIERGAVAYALIVDGENSHYVVHQTIARFANGGLSSDTFRQNLATLTLGSGAAAMVLCRAADHVDAPRFVGSVTRAATEHNHLCRGQVDHMTTDTSGLLNAGVELAQETMRQAVDELDWDPTCLDEVVLHQVSRTHTEKLVAALSLDPTHALMIYPEYGNIGPASVPIVLSKSFESGRLARGMRVGLMGIGSGLNCTMAEIVW